MKIYFFASPRGNLPHNRLIYHTVSRLVHEHTGTFFEPDEKFLQYQIDASKFTKEYHIQCQQITQADICIFETSIQNIALGRFLQEAVRREKPVICLYYHDPNNQLMHRPAEEEYRTQLVEYSENDLQEVLEEALATACNTLNTRFTMLIPPDLNRYLNQLHREEGTNRSEYIRELIRKDMKNRHKSST